MQQNTSNILPVQVNSFTFPPMPRLKKRRIRRKSNYTILRPEEKKKVLEEVKKSSVREVALKYKVSEQTVNRWLNIGIKRKPGCGRKVALPEVDALLSKWYKMRNSSGLPVSSSELREQAKKYGDKNFKASNGWIDKFKKRNGILPKTPHKTSPKPKTSIINRMKIKKSVPKKYTVDEIEEVFNSDIKGEIDINKMVY